MGQSIESAVASMDMSGGSFMSWICGVFRFGGRHPTVFKDGP